MQPFFSALKSPPFEATGGAVCGFYASGRVHTPSRSNWRRFTTVENTTNVRLLLLGLPLKPSNSGFGGKRTSDGVAELCRLRRSEKYEVREDEVTSFAFVVRIGAIAPFRPLRQLRAKPTPLQAACTSAEVQIPPAAAQLQRGTSPPLRIPQLSEGDERF